MDDSTAVFDSSIQATKAIDKNSLKTFSISKLARSLAQSNRLDEAQRPFDEAIRIANITEDNSIDFYVIATSLAESKEPDEAIKTANRIEDIQISLTSSIGVLQTKPVTMSACGCWLVPVVVGFEIFGRS